MSSEKKKKTCGLTSREIPTLKKIPFTACNLGKKSLTHLYVGEKNLSPEVLGKKILTQTKSPIPRPTKSQMVGPLPLMFKPVLQQIKVEEATCVTTDFLLKSGSQLFATCNNLICCNKSLNAGGKTRNIAIQLILQQCCKTSCTFLLPVLQYP